MYNLVRENGRSAARLTAWAESGYGTVIGVWSPDCVGHFHKLPACLKWLPSGFLGRKGEEDV